MAKMSGRIQQITADLNELMRELSSSDEATAKEFVHELSSSQLVPDFKASVDAMRHMVWLYIDAAAREKSKKHPAWEDSQMLDRATGLLRTLHGDTIPQHLDSPRTFLESIETLVDLHKPKSGTKGEI